jgi:hypothetical protein
MVAEFLIEAACPTETGTAEGKEGAWSPGTGTATALADELARVKLPAILEQDQLVRVGLPVKAGPVMAPGGGLNRACSSHSFFTSNHSQSS